MKHTKEQVLDRKLILNMFETLNKKNSVELFSKGKDCLKFFRLLECLFLVSQTIWHSMYQK